MTVDHRDSPRFSRELDDEWLRQQVRGVLAAVETAVDEDELARELTAADPLGPARPRRWLDALREVGAGWPGRSALATATCALVLSGFIAGQVMQRPGTGISPTPVITPERGPRIAEGPTGIPPVPIYSPEHVRRLGVTGSTSPESDQRFRDAMAFHGQPGFASKALPLLREAVALDPGNDQAQFWLGVVLLLEGRDADAVRPLEEASRLGPGSSLYKRYLLYAYLKTGALEKALGLQTELLRPP